ncbi:MULTISPECIES: benenodin family lasso peptide [Stakelama]|uniref:Benenodin family lasso peptide n=2 Tax=Stakelama TaxID=1124625 RepID=A0A8T4IDS8_9SPHN|nr:MULTISPECIES: benenodin family lasso peptide [Stakelama]MBR0552720.1 benenodin family lasso peptide [Stakelama marina]WNO53454.1 benenodin family lasso peptide [Stakelama sp. W311]
MEREDDVIDLGAASIETQGPGAQVGDEFLGLIPTGLADD